MSQMPDDVPESKPYTQLQMVWPKHLLNVPPAPHLAPGYSLGTYRKGDEPRFYKVMELAGWPGWNDEKLRPWLARIPPGSWFMIIHEESGHIVATAMAAWCQTREMGSDVQEVKIEQVGSDPRCQN